MEECFLFDKSQVICHPNLSIMHLLFYAWLTLATYFFSKPFVIECYSYAVAIPYSTKHPRDKLSWLGPHDSVHEKTFVFTSKTMSASTKTLRNAQKNICSSNKKHESHESFGPRIFCTIWQLYCHNYIILVTSYTSQLYSYSYTSVSKVRNFKSNNQLATLYCISIFRNKDPNFLHI